MDIDPASQIERLQKRSLDRFDDFVQKWIPMETKYFEAFSIKAKKATMCLVASPSSKNSTRQDTLIVSNR